MLDSLPIFDVKRSNYSSASEHGVESSTMITDQALLGVLEEVDHQPRVTHPLGLVMKKMEVGQEGPQKFRMITDARASGLNDCIRDCPFPLPTINEVVRGAHLNWWAAKFDLRDGFYHIPVNDSFVDLLGVVHPTKLTYARYRFLCFGLKCAPFFF